ncbi:ArsR family transcriptional regulator [Microbispora sp. NBRC 16548]|nr:ArsR family transcriptional regulator [Microbispora sp. NBRC 16548]
MLVLFGLAVKEYAYIGGDTVFDRTGGRYRGRVTTDPSISAVAALDDVLRQGMYAYIRRARRPVTRDEAAASVGISRKLAAFHLDKLVDAGLLRARYEAVGGIRKVGRTPKVYEPAETDIRVTIPERRHEVLADILMDAVLAESEGESARQAAVRVAGRHGEEIGAAERARAKPGRLGAERALTLLESLLARHGFEPGRESPTCVRLRNCPFHPLAARAPELVCGVNHAFLDGMLTGLEASRVRAVLVPRPGECCVELRSS